MPDDKTPNAPKVPKDPEGFSPVSGAPIPVGRPWTQGDPRAREAAMKSVASRKRRKTMKQDLLDLLEAVITDKDGSSKRTQERISLALIDRAMSGDTKAFEIIRDTIGEKPADKVAAQQVSIDLSHLSTEEIKAILDNDASVL